MSELTAPLLALRDVSRTFGRGAQAKTALDRVSLEVPAGRSVGIVGESGAGKSTILKLLLGLDQPTAGTVEYAGSSLASRRRADLSDFRRNVQIVFQDPRASLDPRMRVGAIVAEPLRSLRVPGDHQARVHELLASVGLEPGMADRYPSEFSGGQRQRIAIARALAPSPKVLVADEPVSALDVAVRAQVIDLLARLKDKFEMSLVLVSHDIAIVGRLCEETIVLRDGRIAEQGKTLDVLTDPQADYTRQLLAAVPVLP